MKRHFFELTSAVRCALYAKMKQVITKLIQHEAAAPFLALPSYKDYPDYDQIIRQPICLNRIEEKVKKRAFWSLSHFKKDIMKVWKNCQFYNQEGSPIFTISLELESYSEQLLREEKIWQIDEFPNSCLSKECLKKATKRPVKRIKEPKTRNDSNEPKEGLYLNHRPPIRQRAQQKRILDDYKEEEERPFTNLGIYRKAQSPSIEPNKAALRYIPSQEFSEKQARLMSPSYSLNKPKVFNLFSQQNYTRNDEVEKEVKVKVEQFEEDQFPDDTVHQDQAEKKAIPVRIVNQLIQLNEKRMQKMIEWVVNNEKEWEKRADLTVSQLKSLGSLEIEL